MVPATPGTITCSSSIVTTFKRSANTSSMGSNDPLNQYFPGDDGVVEDHIARNNRRKYCEFSGSSRPRYARLSAHQWFALSASRRSLLGGLSTRTARRRFLSLSESPIAGKSGREDTSLARHAAAEILPPPREARRIGGLPTLQARGPRGQLRRHWLPMSVPCPILGPALQGAD